MGNYDDYKHEERARLENGNYRLEIVGVEDTVSKSSGNPMIVVSVRPNGSNITIKHYIVKNQYFNRNMTELFMSFGITEGDFNFLGWVGAVGAGRLEADDKGYMRVKYLLDPKRAEKLPPWVGVKPERQTITTLDKANGYVEVGPEDELPF